MPLCSYCKGVFLFITQPLRPQHKHTFAKHKYKKTSMLIPKWYTFCCSSDIKAALFYTTNIWKFTFLIGYLQISQALAVVYLAKYYVR